MTAARPLPAVPRAALSFAGSALGLEALFLWTMYGHFGQMDWPYFWFATIRIVLISLAVAAVMYFATLRSRMAAAVFGCILGFCAALAYYFTVVAGH